MFTSWDKAIMAAITAAIGVLIGAGFLSDEQGTTLVSTITPLVVAVVGFAGTYFWPNKE